MEVASSSCQVTQGGYGRARNFIQISQLPELLNEALLPREFWSWREASAEAGGVEQRLRCCFLL